MGQAQCKAAQHLVGLVGGVVQAAEQAVMDDKMEHGGGNAGIDVRLEQRFELLVDTLADGALAEAVAAGNVKSRHQGFAVGEHAKGQRVDVAGIAHGVKLTGVGKDDGQHADTLEQIEHAQRICGTAFGSLHKKVLLCAAPRPGMAELPDFWRIMLKIRDIYNKYNAFCPCCQSNAGRKHDGRIPGKVYHTHGLPATKGRIYIRVHRLTASLSCIFVQLNLAFEPSMRYTLG